MIYLSCFFLSLFVAMALIPALRRGAGFLHAVDLPDPRKVHSQPIARTGGLGIAAGAFAPLLLWWPGGGGPLQAVLVGGAILVVFGFLDDVRNLGHHAKFAGQLLAALVAVLYGGIQVRSLGTLLPADTVLPPWLSVPLAVVAIVGVTNAINLADGLDGLAGGISALGLGCLGHLAYQAGDAPTALVAASLLGGIFGFLRYNNHPATVFMGDAGSQFLGFMTITLALNLTQGGAPLSPLLPLLVLGFPVLDTLAVMGTRVRQGRSPFSPDKNHFHHKLLSVGLSHADAVGVIYLIQGGLVVTALALRYQSDGAILGLYGALCVAALGGMALARRHGWRLGGYGTSWKSRLRDVRRSGVWVRVLFRLLVVAVPGALVASALLAGWGERSFGLLAVGLAAAVVAAWGFAGTGSTAACRVAVYLAVPLALYLGERGAVPRLAGLQGTAYTAGFVGVTLLAVGVGKLSRRKGFRNTPLDLLMLVIALGVARLSQESSGEIFLAAKLIALFYGYEVLLAELRGELRWVWLSTLAALGVLALKGLA